MLESGGNCVIFLKVKTCYPSMQLQFEAKLVFSEPSIGVKSLMVWPVMSDNLEKYKRTVMMYEMGTSFCFEISLIQGSQPIGCYLSLYVGKGKRKYVISGGYAFVSPSERWNSGTTYEAKFYELKGNGSVSAMLGRGGVKCSLTLVSAKPVGQLPATQGILSLRKTCQFATWVHNFNKWVALGRVYPEMQRYIKASYADDFYRPLRQFFDCSGLPGYLKHEEEVRPGTMKTYASSVFRMAEHCYFRYISRTSSLYQDYKTWLTTNKVSDEHFVHSCGILATALMLPCLAMRYQEDLDDVHKKLRVTDTFSDVLLTSRGDCDDLTLLAMRHFVELTECLRYLVAQEDSPVFKRYYEVIQLYAICPTLQTATAASGMTRDCYFGLPLDSESWGKVHSQGHVACMLIPLKKLFPKKYSGHRDAVEVMVEGTAAQHPYLISWGNMPCLKTPELQELFAGYHKAFYETMQRTVDLKESLLPGVQKKSGEKPQSFFRSVKSFYSDAPIDDRQGKRCQATFYRMAGLTFPCYYDSETLIQTMGFFSESPGMFCTRTQTLFSDPASKIQFLEAPSHLISETSMPQTMTKKPLLLITTYQSTRYSMRQEEWDRKQMPILLLNTPEDLVQDTRDMIRSRSQEIASLEFPLGVKMSLIVCE